MIARQSRAVAVRWSSALLALLLSCGAAGVAQGTSTASCAALGRQQQRAAARVIVVGRMLAGPSIRVGGRVVLLSPARLKVGRYLKGSGPRVIRLRTAVSSRRGQILINEDGIMPSAGQRWEILSPSAHPPLNTSICSGSRSLV